MSSSDLVSALDGSTFVVSDRHGDIEESTDRVTGLFHEDTRFLSRWILTIGDIRPAVLSADALHYFRTQFFLVPTTGTIYVDSTLSVIRTRKVGLGFHEDLTVINHGGEPVDLDIRMEAGADFADLFEVKDKLQKVGQSYRRIDGGALVLGYRRETFVRETRITATRPMAIDDRGLRFTVHLEPHSEWTTCIDVLTAHAFELHTKVKYGHGDDDAHPIEGDLARWRAQAPQLKTSCRPIERAYERSIADLAALRFVTRLWPDNALPAAGLPWFMTVFGRDSIITSLQSMPYVPKLAEATLRVLGTWQGTAQDDFREEEPGKILHEMRYGELTAFEERPHSPYFGAADSTPLYLVLLDEYERWSGDVDLVRQLEPNARAALRWIDEWGDRDGDGYVEYARRNETSGLDNQCWKDSPTSIRFADGTLASLPRATCEIQGYVYDAKVRCARLARDVWGDLAWAQRLEQEAADLKARFNRDFWLADRGYFALALDGSKRKVDALTSNIGHLLWSGIVDEDKAGAVVRHLLGERLFSGWGVRTMGSGDAAYNPIGYHVGTVWPHDNGIIAAGLRRYGYRAEAARVAFAILEAADFFEGRLPEAFAGYPRPMTRFPVEYPTACSPQAWATGAPLQMITTLLGLEPIAGRLLVDPAIPTAVGQIGLLGISGRWGHADAFGLGHIDLDGASREDGEREVPPASERLESAERERITWPEEPRLRHSDGR